jgi:DNA mismatch endonuclease, patch repair protein
MVDVVDRATRSRMMAGIKGGHTKPEREVRSALHRLGFRFRLHAKLPGRPDLVLPRYRAVIFVHGCFWHRHKGCRFSTTPSTNVEFWNAKFQANVARDKIKAGELEALGWRVITIWACRTKRQHMLRLARLISRHGASQAARPSRGPRRAQKT